MTRALLVFAVALSLVTAGLGLLNKQKLTTAQFNVARLQEQADTAASSLKAAEETLKSTQSTCEALSQQNTALADQVAALTKERDVLKTHAENIQKTADESQTHVQHLEKTIAEQQSQIDELTKAAHPQSGTEQSSSEAQKKQTEEQVAQLEKKLTSTKDQLTNLAKREKDRQSGIQRQGLEGKILAVNQEWNFVVLNIGDRDGVAKDSFMLVHRGAELIGKVRISAVEPSTSIADIISSAMANGITLQPGDRVIFQAPDKSN